MKRNLLITGAAVVILGGAVAGAVLARGSAAEQPAANPALPPATATVTRTTLVETRTVLGTLGYGDPAPISATGTGTLTWIAPVGSTVKRGEPLFKVDERPVVALYGSVPLYRTLHDGVEGADVQQLQENLAELGYTGFTVDGVYDSATAEAVRTWQADLGFGLSGTVATVPGQGDRVRAGEVLVELGTTDLELEVAKARLQLQSAEASLAKANQGATAEELAAAQASVKSAQANLAALWQKPSEAQVAAARAALAAAEEAYADLQAKPRPEDVERARLELDQAKNSLWGSQLARGSTCGAAIEGRGSQGSCDSAEASVLNAEVAVQLAQMAYEQAQRAATQQELQVALAQVERARYDLEQLLGGPDPAAVAAAQAQLESAQSQLAQLAAGPSVEDIAIAEAQLEQARLTLRQAERNLLPEIGTVEPGQVVFTPGAVRIAEHTARVGDVLGERGAPLLSYTGTTRLVTVELDVADQALAVEGRKVTVTVPGREPVEGAISQVGTVVTAQEGTTDAQIEVTVTIADQEALGSLDAAPVDVDFVSEERKDVLAVPVAALLALAEGGFGLEIVDGDATRIVAVRTGMFAGGRVEVSGQGIAEGVTVGVPK